MSEHSGVPYGAPRRDGDVRELVDTWRESPVRTGIGHLHHAVNDEGDGCVDAHGVLWFRWMLRNHNDLVAQLELLSLLAALRASDVGAFESFLNDFGDPYTQYFLEHRARYERAYSMGVYIKIHDDKMLAMVEAALLSHKECRNQTQCVTLKSSFLGECEEMQRVPIWLEFEPRGVVAKKAIASALTLVENLNALPRDDIRIGAAFEIAAVQFDVDDSAPLDVESMAQLASLTEAGVRLPFFQFGMPFSTARTPDVVIQTVRTVDALLGPRCVEDAADRSLPRLGHLEVTIPMATSLAVAVCTAIVESKTLRSLQIDHSMARRLGREHFPMDRCWRWLAYALFSRDATHNIEKLEVTAEILSEFDADLIREVLAMEDPLLALVDPRSGIEAPLKNVFVSIPSGTEISLVYDYTRARKDIATFLTSRALFSLRVLQNDIKTGWVTFVLPGWGEARVQRGVVSLQERCGTTQASPQVAQHSIPHLRLNYISSEDIDAVCSFLDVVGPFVLRLDIHETDVEAEEMAEVIVSFARRCPRLEVLDLFAVKMDTIQPLVYAYENGDYTIRKFKFRQLEVQDMGSMHGFFDTLTDPTHPMTACLREISFHVFERTIQDPSRGSIFSSCTKMLAQNNQLEVCRALTMSDRRYTQFSNMFKEFDNNPLPARKGPLELRSKLAFLSVVMGSPLIEFAGRTRLRALDRVDTNVLNTIFKFAAENQLRQSVVEVPVRKWA